jgi:hypothetical protein
VIEDVVKVEITEMMLNRADARLQFLLERA